MGASLVAIDGLIVESHSDWRIIPRLIRGMQGLMRAILSVIAAGTSLIEALANPSVLTWLLFAYEVASFFFPMLFPAVYTRFSWLDVISSLASIALMIL